MAKARTLLDVEVGDLVASITTRGFANKSGWTGTIHPVTKVSAKRFMVCGNWIDKSTGHPIDKGARYNYVLATPEMIKERDAKNAAYKEQEEKRAAFRARADYQHASAIHFLLDQMSPENHLLDKLTEAEWAEFRRKLEA